MNLKEMQYVITVAKHGNITKAADELFVAQPSISRCIQRIENDLGAALFKRTSEGLKLTFAGNVFIENSKEILRIYKNIEVEFSKINDLRTGNLIIGTATHLGTYVLPTLLAEFRNKFPDIEISIVEGVSTDIEEDLLKGEIDVAILHTPTQCTGLVQRIIVKEKFLLAIPPNDPLNQLAYKKESSNDTYLDLEHIRDYPFILTHSSQRTRQVTDRILKIAGIEPKIAYLTKSIQTSSRLVRNNMGVALVPQSYCEFFNSDYVPNYYYIDEKYNPTWQLIAAYSEVIPISRSVEELINIAMQRLPLLYNFT